MSSHEFAEWLAFDRLDPIGAERADLRSAIVASVIANTARDERAHPQPYTAAEFMLRFDEGAEPAETHEEAPAWRRSQAAFRALIMAQGKGK
jgi:hypothetical protein